MVRPAATHHRDKTMTRLELWQSLRYLRDVLRRAV